MKIAIIQPRVSYYLGGGEKVPLIHADLLSKKGHSVFVYTTKVKQSNQTYLYRDLKKKTIKNVSFIEFSIPTKYKYIYQIEAGEDRNRWDTESLLFNHLIYDDLKKTKPDVIISYYILDGLFKPLDIKSIVYLLGYSNEDLDIRTSFLRFFDATISISKNVQNQWIKYLGTKRHNYILNSGVDINNDKNEAVSDNNFNIVFAGRLVERKGVGILLEVFSMLKRTGIDARLWIIGDGPKKSDYIHMADKLNISSSTTFTGSVSNLKDYFRMSTVCVFPSYEKEGLMGVVLEAMSVGKPVITTINNGNEDIIKHNQNGILIKPKNKTQLFNSIFKLYKSKVVRDRIGKNARRYVIKNMTWEIFINKFNNMLNQINK